MEKKLVSIFLLALFFSVVLSDAVSAAMPTNSVFKWFGEETDWPPYGTDDTDPIPRWYVGLVWLALGTVIFVTASKIPPFKESSHKNAILLFAFAFSGIAAAGTGFVNQVAALFGFGTTGLMIIGFIALTFLFVGLLTGSMGLGAKIGGGGLKLGSEGVEAAREAKRDITGEKRDEQLGQRLLSGLERFEQGGLRDVNNLISYVQEIGRVLSNSDALKNKRLRQVLVDRIANFNSAIGALRLHTSNIEKVTRAMQRVSMQEINLLKREMIAVRNSTTPAGAAHSITDAQINTYVNNLQRTFMTDYRSETDLARIEYNLNTAETVLWSRLADGVSQLNTNDIPDARTSFAEALSQLQVIGSELAELEKIENGIEARIQTETKGVKALDHLIRI